MRIVRRRGGAQLQADPGEASLLARLIEDFADAVEAEEIVAGDPVHDRLFPPGYADDADAAAEFRSLTEATLRGERCERARRCVSELGESRGRLQLDPGACERWLKVLNDLRLTLGTRLEISEDDYDQFDPGAPDADQRSLYLWLTATQDALVRAVMG
jgi:hypothetical protein